jgi:hypothetical protein
MVRLEVVRKLKNPTTSSGIEPTTFMLVVYYLNQLRYRIPHYYYYYYYYKYKYLYFTFLISK